MHTSAAHGPADRKSVVDVSIRISPQICSYSPRVFRRDQQMVCTEAELASSAAYVKVDKDHLGSNVFASEHQPEMSAKQPLLIIDVSAVRTVDSSGLGALASIYRRTSPDVCILLGAGTEVAAAVRNARLTYLFEIAPDTRSVDQLLRLHGAVQSHEELVPAAQAA